jgi:hypothetical protein
MTAPKIQWKTIALAILPLVALFAPVMLSDRMFAFRDTAVFYEPLFAWIETGWAKGELPLWNPHLNRGVPLASEATSSLFYPGKLLLLLPLEFTWKFKLYVIAHAFLALAGAAFAVRRAGGSPEAAALAAIAYAGGGAVVFQTCNVVFLVSAAWLPWAFAAIERLREQCNIRSSVLFALTLALMVLGGDPQMAYHAALAAAGYVGLDWLAQRKAVQVDAVQPSGRWTRISLFVATGAMAFALAAVQILPGVEAGRRSTRALASEPRGWYEWITAEKAEEASSESVLDDDTLNFSFAPWHVAEFFFPNVAGSYFPVYRRWMEAFVDEPRIWSVSVYAGLLPALLGLLGLRLRGGSLRERWLTWCMLVAFLSSFGEWGLYRGLVWLLPGYSLFRYPAKLVTFAACPLCLLAALTFDRLRDGNALWLRRLALATFSPAVLLGLLTYVGRGWFVAATSSITPDPAYGPFDAEGTHRDLLWSLVHVLAVSASIAAVLYRPWHDAHARSRVLLAIAALDIVIANRTLIATAPSESWRVRPLIGPLMEASDAPRTLRGCTQCLTTETRWSTTSSPERLEELAEADRHTARANHALAAHADAVDSLVTLRNADVTIFQQFANDDGFWGNYCLAPTNAPPDAEHWTAVPSPKLAEVADQALWRQKTPFPRAWIVHDVTLLPPLDRRTPASLVKRSRAIVEKDVDGIGVRRDFRGEAVVETAEPLPLVIEPLLGNDTCQVLLSEPNHVTIEAQLHSAGLLVLADTFSPGWEAVVSSAESDQERPVPILRADRIYRGIVLPAGKHIVTFRYRPASVHWGAIVSAMAWAALAVAMLLERRHRATH